MGHIKSCAHMNRFEICADKHVESSVLLTSTLFFIWGLEMKLLHLHTAYLFIRKKQMMSEGMSTRPESVKVT